VRVISGICKGRRLSAIKGLDLRPTSDLVKEAIFDVLQDRCRGLRVLDLFAGSGALGVEALSRGARGAVFIEKSRRSLETLRKNITACRLSEQAEIFPVDVFIGLGILEGRGEGFGIVFLDPPYDRGLADKTLERLAQSPLVSPETLVVAEHSAQEEPRAFPPLYRVDFRRYGNTRVSFFQNLPEAAHIHFP